MDHYARDADLKRAEAGDASSQDEAAPPYIPEDIKLTGKTSPGVKRIEAISKHITFKDRVLLFITIFILAYAYTLDNTLRYTFQVCSFFAIGGTELEADLYARHMLLRATASTHCLLLLLSSEVSQQQLDSLLPRRLLMCLVALSF